MSILGSIAGAVAGPLVSGLFGGKDRKQTTTTDFVALRDNALEAGFNPLTALRATGGAGFQNTVTDNSMSTAEWIGQALSAGAQAALNYDPHAQERSQLDLDIARETLNQMRQRPRAPMLAGAALGTTSQATNVEPGLTEVTNGPSSEKFLGLDLSDMWRRARESMPDLTLPDFEAALAREKEKLAGVTGTTTGDALFTAFGIPFQGSGLFSTAEGAEQFGGEPLQWMLSPFIVADAVANTAAGSGPAQAAARWLGQGARSLADRVEARPRADVPPLPTDVDDLLRQLQGHAGSFGSGGAIGNVPIGN